MTREEAIKALEILQLSDIEAVFESGNRLCFYYNPPRKAITMAIEALKQYPCEDAISRQAVFEQINCWIGSGEYRYTNATHYLTERIKHISSVNPQDSKTEQFAKWVASEIFDDNWEYNKDAFAEIACRKLAKLGIVKANGDEWELFRSQESEE